MSMQGKKVLLFSLVLVTLFLSISLMNNNNTDLQNNGDEKYNDTENLKRPHSASALWAFLNLTNTEINGTKFYHNSTVSIEGKLSYPINKSGISGYEVALLIDGILNASDITNDTGDFAINYIVPLSMNIYTIHTIAAQVIDSTPGDVILKNYFTIEVNATSYFDLDYQRRNTPQLADGFFTLPSVLRYDNATGITNATVEYYWYNNTVPQEKWPTENFTTSLTDGSFPQIYIPDDNVSDILYLNCTYSGLSGVILDAQQTIAVHIYRNITCMWKTVSSASQGSQIAVSGQLFSINNSALTINFTSVRLWLAGSSIGTTTTDAEGVFSLPYTISGVLGPNMIEVELLNYPNINSNNTHLINIAAAPVTPSDDINGGGDKTPPPFQNFFMVLIPIIIGIVAGFAIFGYFYLKKQKEESMLVKLPLESRIRNLKILKETGRMEESLSYLFQSIYMELINGKYGRRIKENETIRDFAIISVRALNLNPATIYPFIQKVEEIIYARPFIINDKDFYETVELFSPIYFELTGYNFVLNF